MMKIPCHMFTDSRSMFDVLTRSLSISERRLIIDLRTLPEAYRPEDINYVVFVFSEDNTANLFTKLKANNALYKTLVSRRDETSFVQWIFRTKASLCWKRASVNVTSRLAFLLFYFISWRVIDYARNDRVP